MNVPISLLELVLVMDLFLLRKLCSEVIWILNAGIFIDIS